MIHAYWTTFVELIRTPFQHAELVWGIVPLYFAWLLNELTSSKANFLTAIQTGFSFLWSGAQWLYPYFKPHAYGGPKLEWSDMPHINRIVTGLVIVLGLIALFSGLRRKYPRYLSFLGHTRFSNYFMITMFPIQSGVQTDGIHWSWDRLVAILLFALPIWVILHFGLMPIRNRK